MQAGLGTKRWSHTTSYYLGNLLRRDIVRQIEQLAVVKAEDGDTDNPSVIVRWKAKLPAIVRASIGSYRNQLILVYDSFRVDCGPLSMPAPVARLRRNWTCSGSCASCGLDPELIFMSARQGEPHRRKTDDGFRVTGQ